MGKGKRMRQQRRQNAASAPGAPVIDASTLPGWQDNPYADKMTPVYAQTLAWGNDNPDLAVELAETSEEDAGGFVQIIKTAANPQAARGAATLLQRWAILNSIAFLHDWPVPVAAMTIEEIITAVREDPTI